MAAAVLLVGFTLASPKFLGDAILSLGLMISGYYGATALACAWYFRKGLRKSARDLAFKGVLPLVGGLMMLAALARSAHDMLDPGYGSTSFAGYGGVFLLGTGSMVLGVAVTAVMRVRYPDFFRHGRATVADLIITED